MQGWCWTCVKAGHKSFECGRAVRGVEGEDQQQQQAQQGQYECFSLQVHEPPAEQSQAQPGVTPQEQ